MSSSSLFSAPMTTPAIPRTLGDTNLMPLRCSRCSELLTNLAPVEVWESGASRWVIVHCKKCNHRTPKQWEKE